MKLASRIAALALPIAFVFACANDVTVGDDQNNQVGTKSCTAAGGVCKGIAPGACTNWRGGEDNGCGSGVGVGCCLDVPTPDAGNDASTKLSCEGSGGQCVGLAPGACAAPNQSGDATIYDCGGGIGVQCCLPPKVDAGADAKLSCTGSGGECVGLAPGSCPAPKSVGDATIYDCGGGIGVMCCLP